MNNWIILIAIFLVILFRVKIRKYFWKDRKGERLTFKQFIIRWKEGVVTITPLQQTTTTLWSFIPMFAGIIWGITVTLIAGTWWMSLILMGSLPITGVQFISNIQKYRAQKQADDMMKELEKENKKQARKKK